MSNPTYSDIIDPATYVRLMNEHVHIGESDDCIYRLVATMSAAMQHLRVVEIGCGPARLTRKLAPLPGIVLSGIDHDASFIEAGRTYLEQTGDAVELTVGDIGEFTGPPAEVVISQGMHHHIPKPDVPNYLQRVMDMLVPGGTYIVSDEFLAPYRNEAARKIVTVLWHCHVIGAALAADVRQLAIEEAKTLLDDIAMGEDNPKTAAEISAVLKCAPEICLTACVGDREAARHLSQELLDQLEACGTTEHSGDNRLDLSRGDCKVSGEVFRTEVTAAGFTIEESTWFGPIDVSGAMGVFTLKKPA